MKTHTIVCPPSFFKYFFSVMQSKSFSNKWYTIIRSKICTHKICSTLFPYYPYPIPFKITSKNEIISSTYGKHDIDPLSCKQMTIINICLSTSPSVLHSIFSCTILCYYNLFTWMTICVSQLNAIRTVQTFAFPVSVYRTYLTKVFTQSNFLYYNRLLKFQIALWESVKTLLKWLHFNVFLQEISS